MRPDVPTMEASVRDKGLEAPSPPLPVTNRNVDECQLTEAIFAVA